MDVTGYRVGDFERLERLIACVRRAKQRDRFRMVLLVVDGWAARLIAEAFASIRRTARNWVRHDRDRGTDGLSPGKTRAKCAAA